MFVGLKRIVAETLRAESRDDVDVRSRHLSVTAIMLMRDVSTAVEAHSVVPSLIPLHYRTLRKRLCRL